MAVDINDPSIPDILKYGNELKNVNLSIAREYNNLNSETEAKDFFLKSGLKLILDITLKKLGEENIKSCFFEYSTLCSTLDSNTLSAFLCLWQNEEHLNPLTLSSDFEFIIESLFKEKLALYYLPQFFIQPSEDKANITILPSFMTSPYFPKIKSDFISYLTKYRLATVNTKREIKQQPLSTINNKTYVSNLSVKKVSYELVKEHSKTFHCNDVLPNHLLLHQIYDDALFMNKSDQLRTILISIPMLGAPFLDNTNSFNGQGALFLYLITDKDIDRSSIKSFVIDISDLNKDLTYNYLFEIGYKYAEKAKRSAIKSAIIQYMARNLSHNTGSHIIPETTIYFQNYNDKVKSEKFAYYQKYSQERMELLAQLSSMKINHNWTNYNLSEIIKEFNESIIPKGLCDDLNNNQKEIEIILKPNLENIYVSLPDGAIGKQALFVILENFIRNAYKHSITDTKYLFEINVTKSSDENLSSDYWCIDLYDKLGHWNQDKRTEQKLRKINEYINASVLTDNAELRDSGWGIMEMKSSAAFLIGYPLERLDEFESKYFEAKYYDLSINEPSVGFSPNFIITNKNLGHRFYLLKPKLLIIDEKIANDEQIRDKDALKSKGILISRIDYEASKKLPHQFIITNQDWNFSNHKVLRQNIDTNKEVVDIENDLWEEYIKAQGWENINIVCTQSEQKGNGHNKVAFFDWHGNELNFQNTSLKNIDVSKLKSLNLNYYHPYKSRSGLIKIITERSQYRYKGALLEAINKNVLIIDERIQNASKTMDNDQKNLSLQEIFSFMGITIPSRNELNLSDFLENPTQSLRDELIKLILNKSHHYVLLHLTILEKMAETNDKTKLEEFLKGERYLNELKNFDKENRALILLSGRGEPPNLPTNSYYLNYTTLYDCLIFLMSKPHLVQILSTIRKR
jgi:hypothetical protein